MDDEMADLDLFDDGPTRVPDIAPVSLDASMRLRDGSAVRFAVHDDEIRMTIAAPDGMVTLTLDAFDGRLFDDLVSAALRRVAQNSRGF
jgi:hypothetical protein